MSADDERTRRRMSDDTRARVADLADGWSTGPVAAPAPDPEEPPPAVAPAELQPRKKQKTLPPPPPGSDLRRALDGLVDEPVRAKPPTTPPRTSPPTAPPPRTSPPTAPPPRTSPPAPPRAKAATNPPPVPGTKPPPLRAPTNPPGTRATTEMPPGSPTAAPYTASVVKVDRDDESGVILTSKPAVPTAGPPSMTGAAPVIESKLDASVAAALKSLDDSVIRVEAKPVASKLDASVAAALKSLDDSVIRVEAKKHVAPAREADDSGILVSGPDPIAAAKMRHVDESGDVPRQLAPPVARARTASSPPSRAPSPNPPRAPSPTAPPMATAPTTNPPRAPSPTAPPMATAPTMPLRAASPTYPPTAPRAASPTNPPPRAPSPSTPPSRAASLSTPLAPTASLRATTPPSPPRPPPAVIAATTPPKADTTLPSAPPVIASSATRGDSTSLESGTERFSRAESMNEGTSTRRPRAGRLRTVAALRSQHGFFGDVRYVATAVFGVRRTRRELADLEAKQVTRQAERDRYLVTLGRTAVITDGFEHAALGPVREQLITVEEERAQHAAAVGAAEQEQQRVTRDREDRAKQYTADLAAVDAELAELVRRAEPLSKEQASVTRRAADLRDSLRRLDEKIADVNSQLVSPKPSKREPAEIQAELATLKADRESVKRDEPGLAAELDGLSPRLAAIDAKKSESTKKRAELVKAEDDDKRRAEELLVAIGAKRKVMDRASNDAETLRDKIMFELAEQLYVDRPDELSAQLSPIDAIDVELGSAERRIMELREILSSVDKWKFVRGVAYLALMLAALGAIVWFVLWLL